MKRGQPQRSPSRRGAETKMLGRASWEAIARRTTKAAVDLHSNILAIRLLR